MIESRRQSYLRAIADHGDRHFDPAAGLLRLPMGARNVHAEHLDDTPRHPLRESLSYALVLLELAERARQGRAESILGRVLDAQASSDPDAPTFGLWPYFQEEPVPVWPWPDFNWADFIGMSLLVLWHRHRRRLSPELAPRVREAIRRAAVCIRRRNVDLNYTNIAIKGTFVTLAAAEITGDEDLLTYALDRFARLQTVIQSTGTFAEYNSPAYAGISLAGLHAIDTYVVNPEARARVLPMLRHLWGEVATHFHVGLRELAGPHARSYASRLSTRPGLLGTLIERATQGAVSFPLAEPGHAAETLYACILNVWAPADVMAALSTSPTAPREVVVRAKTGPREAPRVLTTHLEEAFTLGSVSFQDGWEQRRNLLAQWKSAGGGTGLWQHRYLRDDRPCCSGYFAAAQQGGAVAAAGFLGAYADHHVSVLVDGVTTAFLGVVLDLDAAGENFRAEINDRVLRVDETLSLAPGDRLLVRLNAISLEWVLTRHDARPAEAGPARVTRTAVDSLRIVLPHYEGGARALRWLDFSHAVSAYQLRIAAAGAEFPSAPGLTVSLPPAVLPRAGLEQWAIETAGALV